MIECGGPGGSGNQVAALCNGLDKNRFEIGLVYSVRPGHDPKDYESLARGAAYFFHVPEMVREISPLSDFKAWRRLYGIFRRHKPDIVHGHSSKAGFLTRTAGWAAGVPRIFYSPRGYSFLQTDRPARSRRFYRMIERSIAWIGQTVAVSESEAALAREAAGAKRVRVVRDAYLGPLPSHSNNLKEGTPGGSPVKSILVCAAGRLSFARNPEAFVRLARRLADSRGDVRCVWIGGGELELAAREMIRDLNLSGRIEVTGWLPRAEALDLLKTADVFIHFSRWEGLPNAVLEAMAMKLPVVASDIPGNRDLVSPGHTGFLAKTEAELFDKTLELVAKPALRAEFGKNARALVEHEYTEERMLREYAELYSCSRVFGTRDR